MVIFRFLLFLHKKLMKNGVSLISSCFIRSFNFQFHLMLLPQELFQNKSSLANPENSRGRLLFGKWDSVNFRVFLCQTYANIKPNDRNS